MPDFEEIYQTYFADVYRYILALSRDAHTAEEVTQETFFRALASIDQFRGTASCRCGCARSPGTSTSRCAGSESTGESWSRSRGTTGWSAALRTGTPPSGSTGCSMTCRNPTRRCSPADLRGAAPLPRSGSSSAKTESWARVTYFRARQKLKEGFDGPAGP